MSYQVTVTDVAVRPTAVVAATTTWQEFPALWKELLDEVWACLRAGGIQRGCRNVMLYRDDVPHVEVGVELRQPCPLTGRVVASALPGRARNGVDGTLLCYNDSGVPSTSYGVAGSALRAGRKRSCRWRCRAGSVAGPPLQDVVAGAVALG